MTFTGHPILAECKEDGIYYVGGVWKALMVVLVISLPLVCKEGGIYYVVVFGKH